MNNEYYCKGLDLLWLADGNQMEKRLTSLRPISERKGKTKFCANCGSVATQEALFEVDGDVTLIERYCEICAKIVK